MSYFRGAMLAFRGAKIDYGNLSPFPIGKDMEAKEGVFLVVTDDSELVSTLAHIELRGMEVRVWCPSKFGDLQTQLIEACESMGRPNIIARGDATKAAFYQQWTKYNPISVILALKDEEEHNSVREHVIEYLPEAKILSLRLGRPEALPRTLDDDRELVLSWAEVLVRPVKQELRHVQSTHYVKAVRDVLADGDQIALLLQPDPDPDGLASALALRTVLGRNKVSTPIVSFGKVTRPENIAMMRLLDIEVISIRPENLASFDKVCLLDTQPTHFSVPLPRIDAVIDHHPVTANYNVPFKDVRPYYGATSSILTEYLKAAACPISERLATALLYGIKADTLLLNRGVIDADLDAFVSLYPHINYNLLRRIEKPELPLGFAPILAEALRHFVCQKGVLVSCLGQVEREDLIPQIADFLLQFEDVEWVVCAGIYNNHVIMSVRNVGYVKAAGDVIKRIVAGWGMGGGHRTMGKMFFSTQTWKQRYGTLNSTAIRDATLELFLKEAL